MEWKKERLLTKDKQLNGYMTNLFEEIGELGEGIRNNNKNEIVDAICDITVFAINCFEIEDIDETFAWCERKKYTNDYDIPEIVAKAVDLINNYKVEKLAYVILAAESYLRQIGYDYFKCMDEVLLELNSRVGSYDPSIGKWVKDKSPEAQLKWYKADFNKCFYK